MTQPTEACGMEALPQQFFEQKADWIEMIKSIREQRGCNLDEAVRTALAHDGWRKWANRQINDDKTCRKQALAHIRTHGAASLIESRNGRFFVREP